MAKARGGMEVAVHGVQIKNNVLLSIWEHNLYGRDCETIKAIFPYYY